MKTIKIHCKQTNYNWYQTGSKYIQIKCDCSAYNSIYVLKTFAVHLVFELSPDLKVRYGFFYPCVPFASCFQQMLFRYHYHLYEYCLLFFVCVLCCVDLYSLSIRIHHVIVDKKNEEEIQSLNHFGANVTIVTIEVWMIKDCFLTFFVLSFGCVCVFFFLAFYPFSYLFFFVLLFLFFNVWPLFFFNGFSIAFHFHMVFNVLWTFDFKQNEIQQRV